MTDAFTYSSAIKASWARESLAYRRAKVRGTRISDEDFDKRKYRLLTGNELNTEDPATFTEKLLYLKRNNRDPLLCTCADKFLVRSYIKACGYEELLCPLYGVYDDARDIPYGSLPKRFFLKCSNYSGANYYIDKTISTGWPQLAKHLNGLLTRDYYYFEREWPYKRMPARILCEKALIDDDGALPIDYKFYCFNGALKYFMVSYGEYGHHAKNHKIGPNNESLDYLFKKTPTIDFSSITLPNNIEEMKAIAERLSKPFLHVRVDLYSVGGKIYFGELTFYQSGGFVNIPVADTEKLIGSFIDLGRLG